MRIVVEFRDKALSDYARRLEAMSSGSGRAVIAQALNEGGHALRQQTVAAETAQTGLQGDVLERAQHEIPADEGSLAFTIMSQGGNIRPKYVRASEGGGGVTAFPWNRSTSYPGAWINSGWRGNRAPSPKLGGHVYRRTGAGRFPISQVHTGMFIPTEMTRGQTASVFESGSAAVLANKVMARLGAMLP